MTDPTTARPERPIRAPRGTALGPARGLWPRRTTPRPQSAGRDAPATRRSVPPADSTMMRLAPDLVLIHGRFEPGRAITVADGRIVDVGPSPAAGDADLVRLPGRPSCPAPSTRTATLPVAAARAGDDLDFMAWRDRVLYPYSTRLDREGIYLGSAFAFAEMLLHGATTCVDFFYLQDEGNANAEAVIQAARDVGIRLVLARTMYDWEGAPVRYRKAGRGGAPGRGSDRRATRATPTDLRPAAPHSPHGASPAMIRAGFEVRSRATPPFITCRRTIRGRAYPGRARGDPHPLSGQARRPRRPDDRRALRLARRPGGAPDGRARSRPRLLPLVQHDPRRRHHPHHRDRRLGVRIGLGTDGGCTNNRLCVFEEMRMAALLQRSGTSTARG